jgi:hypothetical protein
MATASQKPFIVEINQLRTLNTKDSAISAKDDELSILENIMPIGTSGMVVPGCSEPLCNTGSPIKSFRWFNIGEQNGTCLIHCEDGSLWKASESGGLLICKQLAPAGSFSNPRFDQWKEKTILIIDASGFWYYTLAPYTSTIGESFLAGLNLIDAAISGTSIAVFKGHVFIASGRSIAYSAPDAVFDFTGAGSGLVVDTYSSLAEKIVEMVATQDYLYLIGDNATHIIYGVSILSDGTTTFNLVDAIQNVGSLYAETVKSMQGQVAFLSASGIRIISGSGHQLATSYLDGLLKKLDLSFSPVASLATVYGNTVYCLVVLVDGVKKIACVFERRCFLVNYDLDLNFIGQQINASGATLYGSVGTALVRLFSGASVLTKKIKTKAYNFGYPVHNKQSVNAGVQLANVSASTPTFQAMLSVIGETSSVPQTITFVAQSNRRMAPFESEQAFAATQIEGRGKRLQLSFEETSDAVYEITGLAFEATLGESWPEAVDDVATIKDYSQT